MRNAHARAAAIFAVASLSTATAGAQRFTAEAARSNDAFATSRSMGELPAIVVRARRAPTPNTIPTIAPITLGIPSIAPPGTSTFSACPDGRYSLQVPGIDCVRF